MRLRSRYRALRHKAAVQPHKNTHGVKKPHIRKKTAPSGAVLNLFKLLNAVLLVELINAAAGVDQLLLAGVEGVALGADLNGDVGLGGAGLDDGAASASDGGLLVFRMDSFLHAIHLFPAQVYHLCIINFVRMLKINVIIEIINKIFIHFFAFLGSDCFFDFIFVSNILTPVIINTTAETI